MEKFTRFQTWIVQYQYLEKKENLTITQNSGMTQIIKQAKLVLVLWFGDPETLWSAFLAAAMSRRPPQNQNIKFVQLETSTIHTIQSNSFSCFLFCVHNADKNATNHLKRTLHRVATGGLH